MNTVVWRQRLTVVFALFLLLLSSVLPVATAEQVRDAELTPVSIQLYWRHQFEFAGFYAAIKQGYYQKMGLDVQLKDWQPNMSISDEVLSGRSTFGIGYSQLVVDAAKGLPVSLVMTSFQYSPVVLVSNKPIAQLADLADKTVMRQDMLQVLSLLKMARAEGASNVIEVPSSWDMSDFLSGKVDVFSGYSTNEPFVLQEMGVAYYLVDPKSYGLVSYDDILFTSQTLAKENPRLVQAVKEATILGWQYALDHPEEMVDWIVEHYPHYKSKQALLYEAKETARYVRVNNVPIGSLDAIKLHAIATMAKDLGFLSDGQVQALKPSTLIFNNSQLLLTEAEQAYLRSHPVIALANSYDWAPFEFMNAKGEFDGISAEYFRYFEQLLGVKFVANRDKPWSEVLRLAFNGELPVLSCAVDTQERQQYFSFTRPYLSFPMVIAARQGEHYIDNYAQIGATQRIAVVKGYWSEEYLKQHYPHMQLLEVGSVREGLEAVIRGKAYALSDNLGAIHYAIKQYGLTGLSIIGQSDHRFELAIGVHKGDPILLSILQKALANITLKQEQEIYNHWMQLNVVTEVDFSAMMRAYYPYFIVLLAAFVSLLSVLWWRHQRNLFKLRLSEAQKALAEQKAEQSQKNAQQEERYRLEQADFFAMVAHEIKTPISIVDFALQNLKMIDVKEHPEEVLKRQDRVERAVAKLNQLVDRFLLKTKLEKQSFILEMKPISLQALSIVWQQQFIGAQTLRVACEQDITLHADVNFLSLAVSNLLDNASKYSPSDTEITLRISKAQEQAAAFAYICVQDQGKGIAHKQVEALFEPYRRGKDHEGVSGVGLGLYVIQKIVSLHAGRVDFSPNPDGQGSVFCLCIPIDSALNSHETQVS